MSYFLRTSVTLLLLLSVSSLVVATRLGSSSPDVQQQQHHQRRHLNFFCFLGVCDDEDESKNEAGASTNTNKTNNAPFGDLCIPLFGQCDPGKANRVYADCENRTDGLFGGRPIFGDCGYVTEVVDGFVDTTDTDGDGKTDSVRLDAPWGVKADNTTNTTDANSTESAGISNWLQMFPAGSMMWDIFGPSEEDYDQTLVEKAVDSVFGSSLDSMVITPFALNWKPTRGNATCQPPAEAVSNATAAANSTAIIDEVVSNATAAASSTAIIEEVIPTPTCMTHLGSDGFYVCRTLFNPYTAGPENKTVCIGHNDALLIPNDKCGCCDERCPDEIVKEQCICRCNLNGINDGFLITSNVAGERCVTQPYAISTVGQQLDVECSTSCVLSPTVPEVTTSLVVLPSTGAEGNETSINTTTAQP